MALPLTTDQPDRSVPPEQRAIARNFLLARMGSFLAFFPLGVWTVVHVWAQLAAYEGPASWEQSVTAHGSPATGALTFTVVLAPLLWHVGWGTVRLFRTRKPIIAAVHGAAVGGGLGLALVADFRVTCQEARFSANFNRLGFHPGFGLTATLPRLVGAQQAALMFYTGRRIPGDEAVRIGLAEVLVPLAEVRSAAQALALEIAQSAPLAVMSTRETVRRGLCDAIEAATERELVEQDWLRRTEDFKEGIKAMADRRLPDFQGR